MNKKTVYIVGAGFSMDFGAPSQSEIVKEIFKLKESYSIQTKGFINGLIYSMTF
jgi:hypothetical protein